MRFLAVAVLCTALAGCAGRTPTPVSVVQPQDQYMDCAAITAEVQANNAKVQQLAADKGMKTTQNVAAGVAGVFIPVLWFGMDFQDTADKETVALQSRQQYLATMASQRRCGEPAAPPPVAAAPKRRAAS
jgi:outer membrane murein-binding lipoprotein Lpp